MYRILILAHRVIPRWKDATQSWSTMMMWNVTRKNGKGVTDPRFLTRGQDDKNIRIREAQRRILDEEQQRNIMKQVADIRRSNQRICVSVLKNDCSFWDDHIFLYQLWDLPEWLIPCVSWVGVVDVVQRRTDQKCVREQLFKRPRPCCEMEVRFAPVAAQFERHLCDKPFRAQRPCATTHRSKRGEVHVHCMDYCPFFNLDPSWRSWTRVRSLVLIFECCRSKSAGTSCFWQGFIMLARFGTLPSVICADALRSSVRRPSPTSFPSRWRTRSSLISPTSPKWLSKNLTLASFNIQSRPTELPSPNTFDDVAPYAFWLQSRPMCSAKLRPINISSRSRSQSSKSFRCFDIWICHVAVWRHVSRFLTCSWSISIVFVFGPPSDFDTSSSQRWRLSDRVVGDPAASRWSLPSAVTQSPVSKTRRPAPSCSVSHSIKKRRRVQSHYSSDVLPKKLIEVMTNSVHHEQRKA